MPSRCPGPHPSARHPPSGLPGLLGSPVFPDRQGLDVPSQPAPGPTCRSYPNALRSPALPLCFHPPSFLMVFFLPHCLSLCLSVLSVPSPPVSPSALYGPLVSLSTSLYHHVISVSLSVSISPCLCLLCLIFL
uniref:cDNA FLJ42265 fis, clone TKIDN2014771 n=1 Tax=Homo sapiens TaxID=9606 RepID=Q6ZVP3_HUMAN|nr:unnamed protein product [Homo sapiens]